MDIFSRTAAYIKSHGLRVTLHKAAKKTADRVLMPYHRWALKNAPDEKELAAQRGHVFDDPPFISIVVPVYNTQPALLRALMDSVLAQTYAHFELVLMDGASVCPETQEALEEAVKRDGRVKLFRSGKNEGISGNTNLGILKAQGSYIALLDHDDLLTPDALFHVAKAITETSADLIYSDEDKVSYNGQYYHTPHFKPDFSPDLLRACNYICHLMVFKKTFLAEAGLLDPRFDGSQDHELALRLSEKAHRIIHISKVLYHWRDVKTSMSRQNLQKCVDAATLAVSEHLARLGIDAEVFTGEARAQIRYHMPEGTRVTAILSHAGDETRLKRCKDSLGLLPFETLVCAPGYPAMNEAARRAQGEVLLFIDSGMVVVTPAELKSLIGRSLLSDAGAVGPTILSPNGRLRHQGYLLGMAHLVANPQKGHDMAQWGYFALERMSRNVSAVSAALMAIRREVFLDAGGFDEGYVNALGDVELCLKAAQKGLYHAVLPNCKAVYHAPASNPQAIVDVRPDAKDAERFLKAHGVINDPFYNPNWSKKGNGYRL